MVSEDCMKIKCKNLFQPYLLIDYKVRIFQKGIGILEVCHRLSVTSQLRLFTSNEKLKSLFSLKNKNLMHQNIEESSLKLKNLIPQRNWTNIIVWVPFWHKIFSMIIWVVWQYSYYTSLRKLQGIAAFSMIPSLLFAWCHVST